MQLWLVSQGIRNGYDTFDSMVVAAETEKDARNTHPTATWEWADPKDYWSHSSVWANSPEEVDVEHLGEADPNTEAGVILASFNAG